MVERGERIGWRPSLAKRFMLGSFVILLVGGAGIGAWVARQIETGVVHRTAYWVEAPRLPAADATGPPAGARGSSTSSTRP